MVELLLAGRHEASLAEPVASDLFVPSPPAPRRKAGATRLSGTLFLLKARYVVA
jgi:hypothetical protein